MNRTNNLKVFLVVALGTVAILALPAIATSKHHDRSEKRHGHHHGGAPAGTIQSFDPVTGKLVISLAGEEKVSGLVTDQTKIKCEDEHAATASHAGEEEVGDDHGDNGEEVGDDHGGDNSGPSGHDDNGTGANCTTADLNAGAVVQRAELELEHGTATFDEVELAD